MEAVTEKWTEAEIHSDSVSKKDIAEFLQHNGNNEFLLLHKLNGKLANVAKSLNKTQLYESYKDLFATKAFRSESESDVADLKKTKDASEPKHAAKPKSSPSDVAKGVAHYKKTTLKKGTGTYKPQKGDLVGVFYTGTLSDGTVFDTNIKTKGKRPPLKFKVGTGKVIRGWDEGLMTMTVGEKAVLEIESEWAYGKKGHPEAGIPPNTNLTFEVELVSID
ncbi:hypothetical protein BB560_002447 [Smittium megazygosporum]|uniref:peptidylprolyl isomerase n=1 Tax=Smittium megazygosporum TaxID=133381 RepID=A0A2T9ZES2_9FUNG|nr:hypothetical protein BB560_002447 [Smittium megazygosporum]